MMGSYYAAQANLELEILLSLPGECWDCRSAIFVYLTRSQRSLLSVCVCVHVCVCVGHRSTLGVLPWEPSSLYFWRKDLSLGPSAHQCGDWPASFLSLLPPGWDYKYVSPRLDFCLWILRSKLRPSCMC